MKLKFIIKRNLIPIWFEGDHHDHHQGNFTL